MCTIFCTRKCTCKSSITFSTQKIAQRKKMIKNLLNINLNLKYYIEGSYELDSVEYIEISYTMRLFQLLNFIIFYVYILSLMVMLKL